MIGFNGVYRRAIVGAFALILCSLIPNITYAFKLKPSGTDDEQVIVNLEGGIPSLFWSKVTRLLMDHFTNGVHEEVTNRIWGCSLPQGADVRDARCLLWKDTPDAVLYGVQWNDNPPFKLDASGDKNCALSTPIRLPDRQPNCWRILFGDAAKRAAAGEYLMQRGGFSLLYRSHFGDLQFLHAMASWNGEAMNATRSKIMMWAEFSYRVAVGDIKPSTRMSEVSIPGFRNVLGQYWSDVTLLFTYGVPAYQGRIPEVAFGSLLHLVQDSFSKSHVSREPAVGICGGDEKKPNGGRIIEFHGYGDQDGDKHGVQDSRDIMLASLISDPKNNVVTVGRHLKSLYDRREPWSVVKDYLEACVFSVAEDDMEKPAGPGQFSR